MYTAIPGDAYYMFSSQTDFSPTALPDFRISRIPVRDYWNWTPTSGVKYETTCSSGVDPASISPDLMLEKYLSRVRGTELLSSEEISRNVVGYGIADTDVQVIPTEYGEIDIFGGLKSAPIENAPHGIATKITGDSYTLPLLLAGFYENEQDVDGYDSTVPTEDELLQSHLNIHSIYTPLTLTYGHGGAKKMPGYISPEPNVLEGPGEGVTHSGLEWGDDYSDVVSGAYNAWACSTGAIYEPQSNIPTVSEVALFGPCDPFLDSGFSRVLATGASIRGSFDEPFMKLMASESTIVNPGFISDVEMRSKLLGMPLGQTNQPDFYLWYIINHFGLPNIPLEAYQDQDGDGLRDPRTGLLAGHSGPVFEGCTDEGCTVSTLEGWEDATLPSDWSYAHVFTDNYAEKLTNECDLCPFIEEQLIVDSDAVEIGIPSSPYTYQSDLVGDSCDNCPNTLNLDQADWDMDDLGDVCEVGHPRLNYTFGPLDISTGEMTVSGDALEYQFDASINAAGWFRYHIIATVSCADPDDDVYVVNKGGGDNHDPICISKSTTTTAGVHINAAPSKIVLRAPLDSSCSIHIHDLRLIDEDYPYQFANYSMDSEAWIRPVTYVNPAFAPQPAIVVPEEDSPVSVVPYHRRPSVATEDGKNWGPRGLSGIVLTRNVYATYQDTSVYCELGLKRLGLEKDKLYEVEFSYETHYVQPWTFSTNMTTGLTEVPAPTHLVKVTRLNPDFNFWMSSLLFEFGASGESFQRVGLTISGDPTTELQFCQRGAGKYAVDNVTVKEIR